MEAVKRIEVPCKHEDTELRLGLPGTIDESEKQLSQRPNKRAFSNAVKEESVSGSSELVAPPQKAQAVGWPPVRSYRRNCLQAAATKKSEEGMYVKVSMDGAPYLRKIDLKVYKSYQEILSALEKMFGFEAGTYSEEQGYVKGSEFEPAYEDKDGDWMLIGDVPWGMFVNSCKRLRIMKGTTN